MNVRSAIFRFCRRVGVGVLLGLGGAVRAPGAVIALVEAGRPPHVRQVGEVLLSGGPGDACALTVFHSLDWLTGGFLHAGDPEREPETAAHHIQNHSWVGQSGPAGSPALVRDALLRVDHVVVRDGITVVASLDNGRETRVPELLAHAYNLITVGRLDGRHSRGGTWLDGPGRTRPDLVGILPATSLNVPAVSAAAALLLEASGRSPERAAARRPETVKAILMASAEMSALPDWAPAPGDGLDPVHGAGILDAGAALAVLEAGPQPGPAAPRGWIVGRTGVAPRQYRIAVPANTRIEDLSVALVWNRRVADADPGPGFQPAAGLPRLALRLARLADNGARHEVAASRGRLNTVQYLFLPALGPGRYLLTVPADTPAVPFALAWNGRPLADRLAPASAD